MSAAYSNQSRPDVPAAAAIDGFPRIRFWRQRPRTRTLVSRRYAWKPTRGRPVPPGRALHEVRATMITLYGFGRVFRAVIGETKDLRVQWALEELGPPYRVHGLDHTGGELDGPAYSEINCLHLVPAIEDDGFTVAESGAV